MHNANVLKIFWKNLKTMKEFDKYNKSNDFHFSTFYFFKSKYQIKRSYRYLIDFIITKNITYFERIS